MRRMHIMLSLAVVVLSSSFANAGWHEFKASFHAFMNRSKLDYERNNAWPEPFRYADRQTVRNHWAPYIQRGNQIEHTLASYHFDDETGGLNQAGQAKLYWILTNAPAQHRTIFVLQDKDARTTETRVDLVQQEITRLIPSGPLPAVVRTHVQPHGIVPSGSYQNDIFKKAMENIPPPVLPGGAGGGGGAGGAGGGAP